MPSLTRRNFVKSLAAHSALLPLVNISDISASTADDNQFIICAKSPKGQYLATKISQTGKVNELFTLQNRGHGSAKSINGDVAIFARRPNTELYLINRLGQMTLCKASQGTHFFGHGTFSPDGKLLYTSENAYDHEDATKTGIIGLWDVKKAKRIAQFWSGGIGNHQIMLLPKSNILVVANGGILTHPDHPRQKLNLSDMQPNLCFINRITGDIVHKTTLPKTLYQLSIRHLDVTHNHDISIAMQYQGAKTDSVPLLATLVKNNSLTFTKTPKQVLKNYKQYIGSIMFDSSGRFFAATSPRGNIATFYNLAGDYISTAPMVDICAIAPTKKPAEFILTSGMGHIGRYNIRTKQLLPILKPSKNPPSYMWDNHMIAL